jgi:putative membrane protein
MQFSTFIGPLLCPCTKFRRWRDVRGSGIARFETAERPEDRTKGIGRTDRRKAGKETRIRPFRGLPPHGPVRGTRRNTMKATYLVSAGIAAMLAACSPASEEPPADETPDASLVVPSQSQVFVDAVAAGDQYEIEAGRLAQKMGTSQGTKDFGTMMVDDHLKSTVDLHKSIELVTPPIPVNSMLTPEQEQKLQQLRDAGDGFDAAYAEEMVASHEAMLATMRDYAANGDLAELKAFAQSAAEIVAGHLEKARQLP